VGITCQDQRTISTVSILICGHLVKIFNQRVGSSTIDVQIDNQTFPQVGLMASHIGSEIWTLQLISKNDGAGTAVLKFTISDDPCIGVTCPDACIGSDLQHYTCDSLYDNNNIPIGHECVPDGSPIPNSPQCIQPSHATHYIEYDLSFLPQQFLDLVGTYTEDISNDIGNYALPLLSSNITYITSNYLGVDKKFRVYVHYTPTMSGLKLSGLDLNHRWIYNSMTGRIESLSLINTLEGIGTVIAEVLIFLAVTRILQILGPWGVIASAIVSIIGATIIVYTVKEIITGISTTVNPPTTCIDTVQSVKDFIDTYLDSDCNTLHPTCVADPPTCDAGTMRAYLACVGTSRWAQCQHMNDQLIKCGQAAISCDQYKTVLQNTDTCLVNGTCTPAQAKNTIINQVVNPVKQQVDSYIEALCNATPGHKYNTDTKKCETVCYFPVFGQCLDTPLLICGVLLGGYVIYKIVSPKKG
jgi:hypothetical protein